MLMQGARCWTSRTWQGELMKVRFFIIIKRELFGCEYANGRCLDASGRCLNANGRSLDANAQDAKLMRLI